MLLLIAAGGHYVLENPQHSRITQHDRYIWLVKLLMSHGIQVPLLLWWSVRVFCFFWLVCVPEVYNSSRVDVGSSWLRPSRRSFGCENFYIPPGSEPGYGPVAKPSGNWTWAHYFLVSALRSWLQPAAMNQKGASSLGQETNT